MFCLKNVERLVKFFRMAAAQHLDICARHLNKILSAIKKHFRGTHKNCAPTKNQTRPRQTRPTSAFKHYSSSRASTSTSARLDSPRLGCWCPSSAPHQEPLYKNNSRPDGECKITNQKIHCTWRSLFCNLCASCRCRGGVAASMTLHEHNY